MSTMLVALLLAGLSVYANACTPTGFAVKRVGGAANGTDPSAYTADQVSESLKGYDQWTGSYVKPHTAVFSCVDSRTNYDGLTPTLATPGGDMAELAAGIVAYYRSTNTTPTGESVESIFRAFMRDVARPYRPFYLHTSESGINYAFDTFAKKTGLARPIVLPSMEPQGNESVTKAWYEALSAYSSQGCGHLKLIMQYPHDYDLHDDDEAGILSHLIKAYYRFFWTTPPGSVQRSKTWFDILAGPLTGKAMVIVNNKGPGCKKQEPDMNQYHGGSQVFVYQPVAVEALRAKTLTPFFTKYAQSEGEKISPSKYLATLNKLQAVQLNATLALLSPLNRVDIFTADVTSTK